MKIEMSGVNVPSEHNPCMVPNEDGGDCANGACTQVWGPLPGRGAIMVCAWHLKEKLESGEWEIERKAR